MSSKSKSKSKSKQAPAAEIQDATPPLTPHPPPEPQQLIAALEPPRLKVVGMVAGMLALSAIASPVSQLSLSPVYGSIPSYLYHQRMLVFVSLVAFIGRPTLERYLPKNTREWIPVFAYYIPVIQFYLFQFSSKLGPAWGPLATESLTFYPLLFLAMFSCAKMLATLDRSGFHAVVREMIPAVGPYMLFSFLQKTATITVPKYIGVSNVITRTSLQLTIGSLYGALAPSKLLLLAVPALLHTIRVNPHYVSEHTLSVLNTTLQSHNWTVIDRKESLTGYISVLESKENEFRLLRCDHSLLGGEWLVTPERIARGQTIPEPIYQVFTMLEAVRLVETNDKRPDSEKSALNIGLGIGTCPSALIAHGINTTIVELDPVVHYFATKYFNLPSTHTAAIMNAIQFVSEVSKKAPESYDYIIHDVFTGGAEPAALFNLHFLTGLHTLLSENGVVAINYAGDLTLPSTKMILNTIHAVFPACRLFRDNPSDPNSSSSEFVNMIVFCTKSDKKKLSFRQPKEADFLNSISRKRFLAPQAQLEIDYQKIVENDEVKRVLQRGNEYEIEAFHETSAQDHWKIMRTVVPDVIWETW